MKNASELARRGLILEALPCVLCSSQKRVIDFISIAQALLVAEHLSFRGAANVLGIRQSAVSRRIRALEDSLGVSIFERHHGGVRLTAAGIRFLAGARSALAQLDAAAKVAGAAGRGEKGNLQIGISSSISAGFLRELMQAFIEQHPQIILEIHDVVSSEYVALVREGRLDVAFTMGTPAVSGCETSQLWTERLFAVLPREHPLASTKKLDWEALSDERFILRDSDVGCAIEEFFIRFVSGLGRPLSIQRFDVGFETSIHLVALGLGLSVTTEATTASSYPGIEFRPIADVGSVIPFSGVWSPNNDNPAFRRFLSLARVLSKKWSEHSQGIMTSGSMISTA